MANAAKQDLFTLLQTARHVEMAKRCERLSTLAASAATWRVNQRHDAQQFQLLHQP